VIGTCAELMSHPSARTVPGGGHRDGASSGVTAVLHRTLWAAVDGSRHSPVVVAERSFAGRGRPYTAPPLQHGTRNGKSVRTNGSRRHPLARAIPAFSRPGQRCTCPTGHRAVWGENDRIIPSGRVKSWPPASKMVPFGASRVPDTSCIGSGRASSPAPCSITWEHQTSREPSCTASGRVQDKRSAPRANPRAARAPGIVTAMR
jgi:hypothetical protein